MDIRTALAQANSLLEEAGVGAARLTAEVLLAHALERGRSYLYGHPEEVLGEAVRVQYGRFLHERLGGKPTQYITGRQEFYGREFLVTPEVLIPRPETEHVIEMALPLVAGGARVADAGCGSGAIAVTLALESGAAVCGTDISAGALGVARENAHRLGARLSFLRCDLLSALSGASMDLVVSNPPYVPDGDAAGLQREIRDFEPPVALFAGPTGLEIYARLAAEARRVLKPGGWLVLELGFKTLEPVRSMLAGWSDLRVASDLAGIPRVVAAQLAP